MLDSTVMPARRYKAYPEYKDSGVEWLGKVPSSWEVVKTKHLSQIKRGASPRPIDDAKFFDDEGDYAWVRIADVTASDTYLYKTPQRMSELGSSLSVKLEPDSLFLSIAGSVGKPCISKIKACIHDGFVYFPTLKIPNKFLLYIYAGEQAYKGLGKMGTQLNLNTDTVGNIKVALPPTIKQINQIVNFLDYETAKIDTLIEKQQRLIELLTEKRQAVISHAVTKGLNPDVPMKDSGVEWLGEVPEHWVSAKLKYYTNQIVDGAHFTPTYTDSGVPFLRVSDIHGSTIDKSNIKYIPLREHKVLIKRCNPEKGDLLLSKNGTIGVPKVVDWDWEFSIFVSLCLIKFKPKLLSSYAEYFFKSYEIKEQINGLIKQSTVINLHLDKIQNFWFSVPPISEQLEIIDYLNIEVAKFDSLIEKAQQAIQLMQERRTALISAAVTGKIDVRDWEIPVVSEVYC